MLRPADIDDYWDRIEAVAHTVVDDGTLTAENVRDECREGRSLCFASDEGVAIVTLLPNRAKNDLELCVVLAVSTGPHGAYEAYLPEIDQIARDLGAARIVFFTRRRGWERKLGSDWSLRSISYVREVTNGRKELGESGRN